MRIEKIVYKWTIIALSISFIQISYVAADEKQELMEIKNTTLNLIEALVEEGLLPKNKAEALIRKAEAKAAAEAKRAAAADSVSKGATAGAAGAAAANALADPDVVRVPYVPEFVRDEIREQVKKELREDVLTDVRQTAKEERWGIPGSLPEWLSRVKFFGDLRVRGEADLFATDNIPNSYLNFNVINRAGGIAQAGRFAFLNTTEDQYLARVRARLGMKLTLTDHLLAGFRVTTGNLRDPVSTNQSLANYEGRYQIGLDWVYLQYADYLENDYNWLTVQAGRIPIPWLRTNLVWDRDLGFEGIVAKLRADLRSNLVHQEFEQPGKNLFLTLGIFPLQESQFDFTHKWLFGAQTGLDWTFDDQSNLKFGIAYYHYENVEGIRNSFNSTTQDGTAPFFVQKGNNMFDIRNDNDPATQLFALASKFQIMNITARYDYAGFSPIHVVVTGDYARNFGFSQSEVFSRTGVNFRSRVNAWQARLLVGYPRLRKLGDWNIFLAYKYLERDSVLDAFTDSDFHLGGTDAKGFLIGGHLGLAYNTYLRLRWLSANAIDGPPLGIDVLQLDVNTDF